MKPKRVGTPLMALPGRSYIQPEPKGVVLIIAPWNYPLSMVMAPLVGAVAAGNCAVMKPSEITSHTSAAIARILPRYLDNDAFAVIEGGVPETTELLEHAFDHILYTGNERVARIVMTAAARHLTPVTLELGGKSPCLIDESADLDVAASRIAWGKFINAGQTCVAPDHVLVHRDVATQFADDARGQDPAVLRRRPEPEPGLLPHRERAPHGAVRDSCSRARKSTPVARSTWPRATWHRRSCWIRPPDSALMQEEIFGPVLPVITVDDMQEAIKFVADRPKPLALYLFSKSKALEEAVLGRAERGQRLHQRRRDLHGVAGTAVRWHRQQWHGPLHGLVRLRNVQSHATGHEAQLPLRRAGAVSAVQRLQGEADEAVALNNCPRSPSIASRTSGSGNGPSAMKRSWKLLQPERRALLAAVVLAQLLDRQLAHRVIAIERVRRPALGLRHGQSLRLVAVSREKVPGLLQRHALRVHLRPTMKRASRSSASCNWASR